MEVYKMGYFGDNAVSGRLKLSGVNAILSLSV